MGESPEQGYKKKGDGRDCEDYKDLQTNQSICLVLSIFQHSDASETVERVLDPGQEACHV